MIDELLNKIETSFRTAFPVETLPTCDMFPRLAQSITVPALLFEVTEITPGTNPGTEQLALVVRVAVHAVTGWENDQADRLAANLAISAALHADQTGNFAATEVGPARLVKVGPQKSKTELSGYATWTAEWTHEIHIGTSTWDATGVIPTQIMLGIAPDIGATHINDYFEVTGQPL